MYGYESRIIKKAEHQRIDGFKLWCWRRLLRVLWTARRSNQSILREINPEYALEGLMLKLTPVLQPPDSKLFSCSVASDSLRPHGLQHSAFVSFTSPGTCSKSCPLNRWCHPTISSSVIPFSSCLQSFPASGAFLMSQFFTSGGHHSGSSASASVPPMNIQDWFSFKIDWFDLLAVQRTLESLLQYHSSKASVLPHSVFFMVELPHPDLTTGKTIALYRWTFVVGSNVSAF